MNTNNNMKDEPQKHSRLRLLGLTVILLLIGGFFVYKVYSFFDNNGNPVLVDKIDKTRDGSSSVTIMVPSFFTGGVDTKGREYEYPLDIKKITAQPSWKPGQELPLLPGEALEIANKEISRVMDVPADWFVNKIELLGKYEEHPDKWHYCVTFEHLKYDGYDKVHSGGYSVLQYIVPVLFNKTVPSRILNKIPLKKLEKRGDKVHLAPTVSWYYYYGGARSGELKYSVDIMKAPVVPWDFRSEMPLNINKAIESGLEGLGEAMPDCRECSVQSITMKRFEASDLWYYVINYKTHDGQDYGYCNQPVLMDGTPVSPDKKPQFWEKTYNWCGYKLKGIFW